MKEYFMEVNNKEHLSFIMAQNRTSTLSYGQFKTKCPVCHSSRKNKNKNDTPLSVNITNDKIIYNCFNCDESGIISMEERKPMIEKRKETKPIQTQPNIYDGESAKWLTERGIDLEVAQSLKLALNIKNNKPVIGFQYNHGDKLEGIKWRTANGTKSFWWEGSSQRLWGEKERANGLPLVEDTIVLTEGEMDTLAIKTAFKDVFHIDCYSVPNGAPNKFKSDKKIDPKEDGRFKYVWNEKHLFDGIKRIILATDSDHAGDVLADELSRRLDKARCYRVKYGGNIKDSNDYLLEYGAEKLREIVLNAEPLPLHGVNTIDNYSDEFDTLYKEGKPKGISTGYESVDKLFTLKTGQLMTITGYPSDGKSAFLNSLCVNIAKNYGWKTCFTSFEKDPVMHSAELSQLLIKKPFFGKDRMSQEEKDYAQDWIKEHFLFQDYMSSAMPSIGEVLEKAKQAVLRNGIRCLVIDPFNFLRTNDGKPFDHQSISDMLTEVQLFCKKFDVLTIFISHPSKPLEYNGKRRVPDGVSISGSMAWFAKSDIGVTVYRTEDTVEIHCWKVRWSWQGNQGMVELGFDQPTGRYIEEQEIEDDYEWADF